MFQCRAYAAGGDILELSSGLGTRLISVGTLETVDPRRPVEFHGKEASRFTQRATRGKMVWIEFDQQRTDRYGRLLAYVTVHITKTGKTYPRAGCQHLRRGEIPISLPEAKRRGHEPCSRCRPP